MLLNYDAKLRTIDTEMKIILQPNEKLLDKIILIVFK